MDLTDKNKAHIDSLSYGGLLDKWRYAPAGDPWFQGETGGYWSKRMAEKQSEDPAGAVTASKKIDRNKR